MFVWLWLVCLAVLYSVISIVNAPHTHALFQCFSLKKLQVLSSCFQLTKQQQPVFKCCTRDKTLSPSLCCGLFGFYRIGFWKIFMCLHHVLCKTSFSLCTSERGDVLSHIDFLPLWYVGIHITKKEDFPCCKTFMYWNGEFIFYNIIVLFLSHNWKLISYNWNVLCCIS